MATRCSHFVNLGMVVGAVAGSPRYVAGASNHRPNHISLSRVIKLRRRAGLTKVVFNKRFVHRSRLVGLRRQEVLCLTVLFGRLNVVA